MERVLEVSPASLAVVAQIAARIANHGGVALIVDYGHAQPCLGDTFQAVRAHRFADPLAEPGEADLTAHVDFAALANAAREARARTHGPITQHAFLENLGIVARAGALSQAAPADARAIAAAIDRLTGKEHMGWHFKVLALSERANPPPGFP